MYDLSVPRGVVWSCSGQRDAQETNDAHALQARTRIRGAARSRRARRGRGAASLEEDLDSGESDDEEPERPRPKRAAPTGACKRRKAFADEGEDAATVEAKLWSGAMAQGAREVMELARREAEGAVQHVVHEVARDARETRAAAPSGQAGCRVVEGGEREHGGALERRRRRRGVDATLKAPSEPRTLMDMFTPES